MGLEHLFSEFPVALAALYCVHFESVRVGVDVVILGKEVRYGVESQDEAADHANDNLLVRNLRSCDVSEVLRNIMSHLRS